MSVRFFCHPGGGSSRFAFYLLLIALLSHNCGAKIVAAADPETTENDAAKVVPDGQEESAEEEVLAGHSYHGDAFNEGPRQAAVLIENMGNVEFPHSAKVDQAGKFFNQGVAALHGFWYLEAERSFRQAAMLEPDLAIAYWGMAMANTNNKERARGLIEEATERRDKASEHERLYIDAFAQYLKAPEGDEKEEQKVTREKRYIKNLEKILHEYPDDVEAKAFLALRLWEANRSGVPLSSHYAVDALLGQVFAANPNHPAHHYRIHLWDSERAENAIHSAGMCGPAIPAIAHMWHMPGHIYSKLHRYADAAWQQEASARVDHAHMIRTRLLPDQIHNFAHNNEWLTRNLIHIGRVDDALEQSRNLVSMPQHPKYNSMTKRGSYRYGRLRLLQTLTEYELWEKLLEECQGPYLEPTEDRGWQHERLSWMAVANHMLGKEDEAKSLDWQLRERSIELATEQIELEKKIHAVKDDSKGETEEGGEEASEDEKKPSKKDMERELDRLKSDIRELDQFIALQRAAAAVAAKDAKRYSEEIEKAGRLEKTLKASLLSRAGDHQGAIDQLESIVKESPGQIRPVAVLARALWHAGKKDEAVKQFEELRKLAADADSETPLLAELAELSKHAGVEGDWRIAYEQPKDLGERPELDSLGPFSWSPYTAPNWNAIASDGAEVSDDVLQGKPRILIFYLGFGCLHCVEQLDEFKPMVDSFSEAGIEIVGISTESAEDFQKGITRYDENVPFQLLANPDHQAFHSYRCWDDFENQPLHGTFLIDAAGRVRWQDIGYEPFTDAKFLLNEAQRLLALPE